MAVRRDHAARSKRAPSDGTPPLVFSTQVSLAEKVAALRDPRTYSQPWQGIDTVETHLSWVFLTPALVYKLKKPVHLQGVDFRSLPAPLYNCREELRLNRRLAASVYLDVVTGGALFCAGMRRGAQVCAGLPIMAREALIVGQSVIDPMPGRRDSSREIAIAGSDQEDTYADWRAVWANRPGLQHRAGQRVGAQRSGPPQRWPSSDVSELRGIFSMAFEDELIERNPAAKLKNLSTRSRPLIRLHTGQGRTDPPALLRALPGHGSRLCRIFRVRLFHGDAAQRNVGAVLERYRFPRGLRARVQGAK